MAKGKSGKRKGAPKSQGVEISRKFLHGKRAPGTSHPLRSELPPMLKLRRTSRRVESARQGGGWQFNRGRGMHDVQVSLRDTPGCGARPVRGMNSTATIGRPLRG
jgi:hypothetical protein